MVRSRLKGSDDTVKGRFNELPDLPLPAHHHAQHAGHHPAHGKHRPVCLKVSRHGRAIFQRQGSGKINSHQVIFLGSKVSGSGQIIILRLILRLSDAPQDLLLCLGIDPHPLLPLILHPGHLGHQAVDILSFPPGVRADVDGVHIRPVQQSLYNLKLLGNAADHFVLKVSGQKRKGGIAPPLILGVVGVRIAHGHQMAHAPGYDRIL